MRNPIFLLAFVALLLSGCSENMLSTDHAADATSAAGAVAPESKLRHPQLRSLAGSVAGKDGVDESQLFVAFNEYEPDGVTRRVLDAYGVTRRILNEYGVTRRVLEQYGVTRRVLNEYGVTRRVLDSYGVTRRVLEHYGITAQILEDYAYEITEELLEAYGTDMATLEAQGVTRRVLNEYGVTRRVLDRYGLSDADFDAALAAWERTIKLKVRIDAARPGIFLSIGTLPLSTFLDEIADDEDIAFAEIDLAIEGPAVGTVTRTPAGAELLPWGVDAIGSDQMAWLDASNVHVYLLDSGVLKNDVTVVERKDFSMLFENRNQTDWDDSAMLELPFFDPGDQGNPDDLTGHGTHIAGTIGALSNGTQVVGVAPGAQIHSLKVMTEAGQTDVTTVLSAIDYVISEKLANPTRPMVMNLSLGMNIESTSYNVLDEGVKRAIENGILAVVSAGNSGMDASTFSPAHVAEALTVGAYGQDGSLSSFSNRGHVVDLSAPGDLIPSLSNNLNDVAANYAVIESGTSMAAGHVTGAAALVLAESPNLSPSRVIDVLMGKARSTVAQTPNGTTNLSLWAGLSKPIDGGGDNGTATESSLPPFYNFAITSGGRIDVQGRTDLWAGFEDSAAGGNASVFANGFLDLDNDDSRINGFSYNASPYSPGGDYRDPDRDTWKSWMGSVVQPNYNPAGILGNVAVEAIEIPHLDVNMFKSQATKVSRRSVTLRGHYELGTKEEPMVWFVNGDVTTRGGVTFSGYGVLLVRGSIIISDDITPTLDLGEVIGSVLGLLFGSSDPEPEPEATPITETMLGLYANESVTFKRSGLTVAAHVFTNSDVRVLRDLTLYGNITAAGDVSWVSGGHNTLYFLEAPRALTDIFWPLD